MRVILAEKPDMGMKISLALGGGNREDGYIRLHNQDVVTWAIGHIIQLKTPDKYTEYKEWSLETLPILPDPMHLEIDPDKKKQFNVIKKLVTDSACEEVIIATDPGREGQLIAKWILEMAGYHGPTKRLWIDDLTEATIKEGFRNLLDGKEKENLGYAAEVRAKADYIIGFTASRFFTLVAREATGEKASLPAGRVQTPTLKIVYEREMAIQNFIPEPFYEVYSAFKTPEGEYIGKWFAKRGEENVTRFSTKSEAEVLQKKIQKKLGIVTSYQEKEVKRHAPQLFHSTSLKTEARKRYGFGIEDTAKIAQSLYDKGYITYTRSASRHLSENAADKLAEDLKKIAGQSKYKDLFPEDIKSLKGQTRFVDNKKAAEHHAIVPTGKNPSELSEKEEKLYELILRQTLAAHYPPGRDRESTVITEVEGETFYTKGVTVIEEGWRNVLKQIKDQGEGNEVAAASRAPSLKEGQDATVYDAKIHDGKTTAPKRLTEDELETAMENAGKIIDEEMEDKEAFDLLKEKGLGTVATRTSIIKNLLSTEYIESKKNLIYLTTKGKNFIEFIGDHEISSIELTGEFESKLSEVENGVRAASDVLQEFIDFTHSIVKEKEELAKRIQSQKTEKLLFQKEVEVIASCPKCKKDVVAKKDFYGCTGYKEGCNFTLPSTFMKAKLGKKHIKLLCEGKKLLLQGLQGQYGAFDMIIFIDQEGKLATQKPTLEERGIGKCPLCGKPVLMREKFYGCTGYKEGCKFTLPKVIKGKTITSTQASKIIEKGKSDLIKGFSGKKPFDAYILYNKQKNELTFEFPNIKRG